MKKNLIGVIMQAFYGNRTYVEIGEENIDHMLQGNTDKSMSLSYQPDRTIIRIPGSQCVILYNKYQEEEKRKQNARWKAEDGYEAKPLAFMPEQGIEVYSRCFACRMSEDGVFESIKEEDCDLVFGYLMR